ncbi:hypothetical protein YC2023_032756 [Brassica napus]
MISRLVNHVFPAIFTGILQISIELTNALFRNVLTVAKERPYWINWADLHQDDA